MTKGAISARRTVADQVSIALQRMIVEGEIDAGQPLPSQRDLAARFGASRASVREAISALSAAGLVQAEHGRGVFVRPRTGQAGSDRPASWTFDGTLALRDAYQIRALIEPFAVRVVTPMPSRDHLEHLRQNLERTRAALEAGDYVALSKEEFAFHWTFAELSGNHLFCDILSRCTSLLPLSPNPVEAEVVSEHAAVVEEAAMGRAEAAAVIVGAVTLGMAASVTSAATSAASTSISYATDAMLRSSHANQAASGEVRAEISRLLTRGDDLNADDRGYLAQQVSAQTGLSPQDAQQRVNTALTSIREAADKARKASSALGFFTALSMLIGAFIASAAAGYAGNLRDEHADIVRS